MFRLGLASVLMLVCCSHASAEWSKVADRWEKYRLSPQQMEWFSKLRPSVQNGARSSVPCCNTADGVPADDWERRETVDTVDSDDDGAGVSRTETHYWVKVNNQWLKVPDEAVITNQGNPVGVPVVWFFNGGSGIRCFVPGPEN